MKQKISPRIEEKVVRLAKRKAAREGRTLSELIQEAVERYLRQAVGASAKEREAAFRLFCERPMKVTPAQSRSLIDEDMWSS